MYTANQRATVERTKIVSREGLWSHPVGGVSVVV